MKRNLLFVVVLFLLISVLIGFTYDDIMFNDIKLIKVEQGKYPKSTIYTDESKKMVVYELKMMQLQNGMLVPENNTVLSEYVILPIEKKKVEKFTAQDYEDIITFINSIDLKNRRYKE